MSQMGHERPKDDLRVESVPLPTADIGQRGPQVAFVPKGDIPTISIADRRRYQIQMKTSSYSITTSAVDNGARQTTINLST
jgi:hypothetical protein